jgi:hypothetical protein
MAGENTVTSFGQGARNIRVGVIVDDQTDRRRIRLPHLVPRTWGPNAGWLDTAEQLRAAVAVGANCAGTLTVSSKQHHVHPLRQTRDHRR